ncbi:hypothetical protein YB2330_003930 [Saitoella coloradoensis]
MPFLKLNNKLRTPSSPTDRRKSAPIIVLSPPPKEDVKEGSYVYAFETEGPGNEDDVKKMRRHTSPPTSPAHAPALEEAMFSNNVSIVNTPTQEVNMDMDMDMDTRWSFEIGDERSATCTPKPFAPVSPATSSPTSPGRALLDRARAQSQEEKPTIPPKKDWDSGYVPTRVNTPKSVDSNSPTPRATTPKPEDHGGSGSGRPGQHSRSVSDVSVASDSSMLPGESEESGSLGLAALASPRVQREAEGLSPVTRRPLGKVMTEAEFKRYSAAILAEPCSDESDSESESESEAEAEDEKEKEKEREAEKKIEEERERRVARLAVYRASMVKTLHTTSAPLEPSRRPSPAPVAIAAPAPGPIAPKPSLATAATTKRGSIFVSESDSSDSEEDIPLNVLAAHGFPRRGVRAPGTKTLNIAAASNVVTTAKVKVQKAPEWFGADVTRRRTPVPAEVKEGKDTSPASSYSKIGIKTGGWINRQSMDLDSNVGIAAYGASSSTAQKHASVARTVDVREIKAPKQEEKEEDEIDRMVRRERERRDKIEAMHAIPPASLAGLGSSSSSVPPFAPPLSLAPPMGRPGSVTSFGSNRAVFGGVAGRVGLHGQSGLRPSFAAGAGAGVGGQGQVEYRQMMVPVPVGQAAMMGMPQMPMQMLMPMQMQMQMGMMGMHMGMPMSPMGMMAPGYGVGGYGAYGAPQQMKVRSPAEVYGIKVQKNASAATPARPTMQPNGSSTSLPSRKSVAAAPGLGSRAETVYGASGVGAGSQSSLNLAVPGQGRAQQRRSYAPGVAGSVTSARTGAGARRVSAIPAGGLYTIDANGRASQTLLVPSAAAAAAGSRAPSRVSMAPSGVGVGVNKPAPFYAVNRDVKNDGTSTPIPGRYRHANRASANTTPTPEPKTPEQIAAEEEEERKGWEALIKLREDRKKKVLETQREEQEVEAAKIESMKEVTVGA